MRRYLQAFRRFGKHVSKTPADGLRHLAVHGREAAKEAARSPERLVDELVNENEIAGRDIFSKRADGCTCYYGVNTQLLEGEDVGCVWDLAR
jgi:hypothetical protein